MGGAWPGAWHIVTVTKYTPDRGLPANNGEEGNHKPVGRSPPTRIATIGKLSQRGRDGVISLVPRNKAIAGLLRVKYE